MITLSNNFWFTAIHKTSVAFKPPTTDSNEKTNSILVYVVETNPRASRYQSSCSNNFQYLLLLLLRHTLFNVMLTYRYPCYAVRRFDAQMIKLLCRIHSFIPFIVVGVSSVSDIWVLPSLPNSFAFGLSTSAIRVSVVI